VSNVKPKATGLRCPSGRPEFEDSKVFGVVTGVDRPVVNYLPRPVDQADLGIELPPDVNPAQVFRFTCACAESKCRHFDGSECTLGDRIVRLLPSVTDALPKCSIRGQCRWFRERGRAICLRCPGIVSHDDQPADLVIQAAMPPT